MVSLDTADDSRDPVEEIAERFISQLRAGEPASIEEYQQAYPQHAEQIAALFPTLLIMEDVKEPDANPMRARDSTDTLLERNLKRLGDFRIIRRIGYGGMGIVYEAEQESLGRRVAMKIFAPTLFSSERQIRRFHRESQAAAKLHHSNIVPVLGVGEQWGIHYYIMQYIAGHPFDKILYGRWREHDNSEVFDLRRNWNRLAQIGSQVADALHYAHSQDVLHRDIKPGNLILDDDGTPWITDFGLAKMMSQDDGTTRTGQTVGTLRYMSPEQLHGEVDARSDVYSLGLTLYELLTWKPAYDESDRSKLVRQKAANVPPQPRSVDPTIPRDLETIVMKAISREPKHRYQNAGELSDDLDRFVNDLPIKARRVSPVERLYRWSRRNPALAAASGIALALAISFVLSTYVGYLRSQRQIHMANAERRRALEKEAIATGTLDHIFDRFGIESIETTPSSEPILSAEATVLLEELIKYYDELADDGSSADGDLRRKAADAQMKIGNMHTSLGQYNAALDAYDAAYEKYDALQNLGIERDLKLARISNHKAQILRTLGESGEQLITEALGILDHALNTTVPQSFDEVDTRAKLRYERARGNFLLAAAVRPGMGPESMPPVAAITNESIELTPTAESRSRLKTATQELGILVSEFPKQPAFKQLFARCLREQAADHLSNRDAEDDEAEQKAIEILETLVQQFPDRLEYQFDLLETLAEMSVFGTSLREDTDELLARLARAIELGESLVSQRPDVTLYASALVHAHYKSARLELHNLVSRRNDRFDRLRNAEEHYRDAISRQYELIRRFPTAVGFATWQALFRTQLAALLLEQHDLEAAQYQAQAAIFLIEDLMQASTASVLDMMLDEAYQTLRAAFGRSGVPPRLLFD